MVRKPKLKFTERFCRKILLAQLPAKYFKLLAGRLTITPWEGMKERGNQEFDFVLKTDWPQLEKERGREKEQRKKKYELGCL